MNLGEFKKFLFSKNSLDFGRLLGILCNKACFPYYQLYFVNLHIPNLYFVT